MAHFPRFRRKKEDATTVPPLTRASSEPPGKASAASSDLLPAAPIRRGPRLSPLHVFHRSSGKRTREPPATEPAQSIASTEHKSAIDLPGSIMLSNEDTTQAEKMKLPAFLDLSLQDINSKFGELLWHENNRMNLAKQNPNPDFRWAKVTPAYPRGLDRYINIQPWNNNRVRLQVPKGHMDYVNASPIVLKPSVMLPPASPWGRGTAHVDEGDRGSDHYIAMQGPKQQSTDHVWRMVVEQLRSPGVIVMLTDTHEGGQEKCWPYFPFSEEAPPLEINEHDEFGDGFRASVRCEGTEETVAGDAIELRKLVIRVHPRPVPSTHQGYIASSGNIDASVNDYRIGTTTPEPTVGEDGDDNDVKMLSPTADIPLGIATVGGTPEGVTNDVHQDPLSSPQTNEKILETEAEERIVWHFLYKKWPDFGVPNLEDLESFFTLMRLSREKNADPQNPRIVHCSAGVGRSGTFIALEHLMRELDAGVFERYDPHLANKSYLDHSDTGWVAGQIRDEEEQDPIFTTVNHLREQRCTMVQAPAQYRFIYQVMRKLWQDKYGDEEVGEPAAKRLEVDPFVEG